MGEPILIYGKSGSGKSRSLKNFGKDEIILFNVCKKRLPFRNDFTYNVKTDKYKTIKETLARMDSEKGIKTAVIDDAGYLLTNHFMLKHASSQAGASVFDMYNAIGDDFWGLLRFIKDNLPEDNIVYIMMHEDTNDYGNTKLKTIGKLLDEKVCIEGMVTVVLRCVSENGKHFFKTQTDGNDITKSPEDMFEPEIDNDLKEVDTIIRDFWGLTTNKNK